MTIRTIDLEKLPLATPSAPASADSERVEILRGQISPLATAFQDPDAVSAWPSSYGVEMTVDQARRFEMDAALNGNAFALVRDGKVDLVLRPADVRIQDGVAHVTIDARDLGDVE